MSSAIILNGVCFKRLTYYCTSLTVTTLWANSADDKCILFFFLFSQKTGYDILCSLSPIKTICMKCQSLFSGKIKRKYYQFIVCWMSPESCKGYIWLPVLGTLTILYRCCVRCLLCSLKIVKNEFDLAQLFVDPSSAPGTSNKHRRTVLAVYCTSSLCTRTVWSGRSSTQNMESLVGLLYLYI